MNNENTDQNPEPSLTSDIDEQPISVQPAQIATDQITGEPEIATPVEEAPQPPPVKACRHEYVRIYQRRLKGLDRRLVATRAYLPIGFKQADFGHLSEGSFCFCTTCRARLYPKRTQADKLAARLLAAQGKLNQSTEISEIVAQLLPGELRALVNDVSLEIGDGLDDSSDVQEQESNSSKDIHVEELELESVDMQDIEAEGVKLTEEADVDASAEEDI